MVFEIHPYSWNHWLFGEVLERREKRVVSKIGTIFAHLSWFLKS